MDFNEIKELIDIVNGSVLVDAQAKPEQRAPTCPWTKP